jgi:cation diffusion facilitator CzcD-associated flavoprotein CzcO
MPIFMAERILVRVGGPTQCATLLPFGKCRPIRPPLNDLGMTMTTELDALVIGAGFTGLYQLHCLRDRLNLNVKALEAGGGVGGTWYWNRYPGAACDVSAYDYMPLLDEMGYVPGSFYAKGPEIFAHCQAIARRYDLYDLAVFQTTVTSTVWDARTKFWTVSTDRGDTITARFVICANGTLSKPKLGWRRSKVIRSIRHASTTNIAGRICRG